jgi:hypothetical protein
MVKCSLEIVQKVNFLSNSFKLSLGIDNDRGDGVTSPDSAAGSAVPAVSSLKTRDAFACYGERLGAELASRSDSAFYLDMVLN